MFVFVLWEERAQTRTLEASSFVSSLLEPELFGFRLPMPPAACSAYCVHPCSYACVRVCICVRIYVYVHECIRCVCLCVCVCRMCMHGVYASMHPRLSDTRVCAYARTRAYVYMSAPGRQACDARAQTGTGFRQGGLHPGSVDSLHPVSHTQDTRIIRRGNLTRQDTTAEHDTTAENDTCDGSAFKAMAGRFFEVAGVTCSGIPARQALPRESLESVSSCALLLSRLLLLLPLQPLLLAPATVSVDAARADLLDEGRGRGRRVTRDVCADGSGSGAKAPLAPASPCCPVPLCAS